MAIMTSRIREIPDLTTENLLSFYSKIKIDPETKCWNWIGAYEKESGRGSIGIAGSIYKVPRVAWKIYFKTDPGLLYVLHTCDNPACVKREHLFLGDASLNLEDCWDKNRRIASSTLYPSDIEEIKQLSSDGKSERELARLFNVSNRQIHRIIKGEAYK